MDSAKQALHLIRQMDFECTNIDLIYGIPGQTMEIFANIFLNQCFPMYDRLSYADSCTYIV